MLPSVGLVSWSLGGPCTAGQMDVIFILVQIISVGGHRLPTSSSIGRGMDIAIYKASQQKQILDVIILIRIDADFP